MSKKLLFLLFLLVSFSSFSQQMEISGSIQDTNLFIPVYGAKTYLVRISDSVIVGYQNTTENGDFKYQIPLGNYRLIISHPYFNTKEIVFVGTSENHQFDLGEFSLADKSNLIETLTIYAYKDPIYYKGDTLIYIADSFQTKDNAVVEDLLKKLPGLTVEENGTISSNGKNIDKVYVDGDEFFGSDPTVATKNLAAKSIDKVQVYEKVNDDDPTSDEKLQILDLKLKANAKKGWFAKATGATDFHKFYEGQLLFNRFQNKQQIFAFGLGSNTLNSAISSSDAQQAGLNSRALGGGGTVNGYPQTFKAGVLFNDQITPKFKFGGNYLFSDSKVSMENDKNTRYLLKDTTYSSLTKTFQKKDNQTHNLSLNLGFNLDSTQTLTIMPSFNLNTSSSNNSTTNEYVGANGQAIRRATNNNTAQSTSFRTNTNISYIKNFAKPKRRLQLRDNVVYNQNNGTSNLDYDDYFFLLDTTENQIRQQKSNHTMNVANTLYAGYTEPLNSKWNMVFDYELYNNRNDKNQLSYDFDQVANAYDELDSLTSNSFRTDKIQNKLGVSGNYSFKKQQLTFGTRLRNVVVKNENYFSTQIIKQNVTNAFPYMNYRFKISQNSNFSLRASTNSTLPSVDLLSPARDNSNPNAISVGNENLKPDYSINANASYMIFKPISGISFNTGIGSQYTFNDFARSLTYDSIGRSVSRYDNINTFNSLRGNMGLSIPLFKKLLTINPRFSYANANQNSIVNGANNLTNTHNFMPELRVLVNWEYLELSTSLKLTEQIGRNSADVNLNINNAIWNFQNDLKIYLPWKIDVNINGKYYNYANMSQGFNSKFFILNSSIDKRLGKYDQWTFGVEGYDLLNQNKQVNRTITLNTIVDSKTNIITRYFLFRVTYSFNSTFRTKPIENEKK